MEQNQISEFDRNKIIELYFDKMFDYEELENYFHKKYSYSQIRQVISVEYAKW